MSDKQSLSVSMGNQPVILINPLFGKFIRPWSRLTSIYPPVPDNAFILHILYGVCSKISLHISQPPSFYPKAFFFSVYISYPISHTVSPNTGTTIMLVLSWYPHSVSSLTDYSDIGIISANFSVALKMAAAIPSSIYDPQK